MAQFTATQWSKLLDHLHERQSPICRQWFHDDLTPGRLNAGTLEILTATPVQRNYLQTRCLDPFVEAAQHVTGQLIATRFVCERDVVVAEEPLAKPSGASASPGAHPGFEPPAVSSLLAAELPAGSSEKSPSPRRAAPDASVEDADLFDGDSMVISPDYAFENFVPGPENELAHAASLAVTAEPGTAYNPLFIHGGVGLGKTHLLQAIGQAILNTRPETRVLYVSCDDFITQFITCVQAGKMKQFRHHYRDVDLLMIDDIHYLANRDRTQEEFHHTFNALTQNNSQIVLSSDAAPHEIPNLEDRLMSRFGSGLVAQVNKPGYETRVAILEAKARLRGFEVPSEVIEYLAKKVNTNARDLEGALITLQGHAILMKQSPTVELARKACHDTSPVKPRMNRATLDYIVDAVTGFYNVKFSDLQSRKRPKSITEPRQICMWLARQRTGFSLEEIGGYFGGRDHTTVMHSLNVVENRKSLEPEYAQQVNCLLAEVDGRNGG